MPIRLNLLAEAQAIEEMRRRDPVKRALWAAALLIALVLVWASSLQLKAIVATKDLNIVVAQMKQCTNEFNNVVGMQKKIGEMTQKLNALQVLTTNRFLVGNLLDALQHTTVEDVQLTRLKLDQHYTLTEATKPRTNGTTVVRGKPATSVEKAVITLDGNDSSMNPGDQVLRIKDIIAQYPYFKTHLDRANPIVWKSSSSPQISPETGKAIVTFSLECRYPDTTR